MNQKVVLKQMKFPKILGALSHSNQFLKVFSLSCLALVALQSLVLLRFAFKDPDVLTLSPSAEALERKQPPKPENEVKAALRAYLAKRYAWEPNTVARRVSEAEAFVSSSSLRAYRQAMPNVVRFSTEKVVSQHAYDREIKVNLSKGAAIVTGDRVTSIQGFKTAADLKLELSFESGPRTEVNPWGIYVTKEREE